MIRRLISASPVCWLQRQAVLTQTRNLYRNEVGAEEGMNKLLIFAMVALPLLALLIFFGNEIVTFAQGQWEAVFGSGGVPVS